MLNECISMIPQQQQKQQLTAAWWLVLGGIEERSVE
jgi:hypothetical protein